MSPDKFFVRSQRGAWRASVLLVSFVGVFLLLVNMVSSAQSGNSEPPVRVPSDVAWTAETVASASSGNAFRGLLLARRCNHCHGNEGFSSVPIIPNLAGEDTLSLWKQLQDFRDGKRSSGAMQPIASGLSPREIADVAAYFAMLPTSNDPQDTRSYPQPMKDAGLASMAVRLIVLGDGQRGIPPCQSCHGPIAYVKGAPALAWQNGGYLQKQLDDFASGARGNDINIRMRSIARQLTAHERAALAQFYGAGLGPGANLGH